MTIATDGNRIEYTGNGVATAFSYPYKFLANSDLVVVETVIATGVSTTKTLTTDYTVSGAGSASGGTVTAVTAPASTVTWTIYGDPAVTQSTDRTDNSKLPAASIEDMADRLTLVAQRIRDMANRSVRLPDGDTGFADSDMELPSKIDRATKYLAFDADGNVTATAGLDVLAIAAANAAASATAAAASAAGVTLPSAVADTFLQQASDVSGYQTKTAAEVSTAIQASITALTGITGDITSTKAAASGYTRVTPNYCRPTVYPSTLSNLSSGGQPVNFTVAAPTGAKHVLLEIYAGMGDPSNTSETDNYVWVKSYNESGRTTVADKFLFGDDTGAAWGAYLPSAGAGTLTLSDSKKVIICPVISGTCYLSSYLGNGNCYGNYRIIGYYD